MLRNKRWLIVLLTLLITILSVKTENDYNYDGNDPDDNDKGEEDDDSSQPKEDDITTVMTSVTRTTKKHPLECYVCAYKVDIPLWSCLDPEHLSVITTTCPNIEDQCSTTILRNGTNTFDALIRGCRTTCITSDNTKCCDTPRCNNQTYPRPTMRSSDELDSEKDGERKSRSGSKILTPTMLLYVTILLILQTIAKIPFF